jgi:hypothetical protein
MEAAVQGAIDQPITGPPLLFSGLILSGSALASPKLWLAKVWRERGGVRRAMEVVAAEYGGGNAHRGVGVGGRSVMVWM